MNKEQNLNNADNQQLNIADVISRLSNNQLVLEKLYENMSSPTIVEPLKELLNRDGYKAGFIDGFRTAISYIQNGL